MVTVTDILFDEIDRSRDDLIAFYRELVRIPSVWGDVVHLRAAAELVAGALSEAGLNVSLPDSGTEGMPNVLGRLRTRGSQTSLLLNGHMEVYPPSESWSRDPFGGEIADGRLYGQGAADMKAGTAAMTMAAATLARVGAERGGDLTILAIPNHFEGGEGTRRALGEGLTADAAIVCEPSDLLVVNGQRGIAYVTVEVHGRAAHTTATEIGVNAIDRAADIVSALRELVPRDRHGNPVAAPKILNVAQIRGGIAHNLVPESCVVTIDIRYPPEQTLEDVLRDVRETVAVVLGDDELGAVVAPEPTCIDNPRSALRLPDDHPLVNLVAAAHERATGKPAGLGIHPAWPDTPIFNEHGIDAVTYGPGSMACYWDDEYVSLNDYICAIKTYCAAATSGVEAARA